MAVLGGAKVSDKLEVIQNLLPKVDALVIGGAMAYTFLKAAGLDVGKSLVEADLVDTARDLKAQADARGLTLALPDDHVVAEALSADVPSETLAVGDAAIGARMGLDIGPKTAARYAEIIRNAKTVVWNGPMGVFEIPAFANGHQHRGAGRRERGRHHDHRRRRLDLRRPQGRRDRPDQSHLHRRRREPRVPGGQDPARRGGPAREVRRAKGREGQNDTTEGRSRPRLEAGK